MKDSYSNYGVDDVIMRTFMMPAVMPYNQSNIKDFEDNKQIITTNYKFLSPEEGFLRGNMESSSYIPYKNMTYLKPFLNSERQNDLYKLQEMDFAAHDLNLYLDTHPNDSNAIRLYNEYNKKAQMLSNTYERKYGPINLSDNQGLNMSPWTWIKEPWPWNK